MSGKADQKERTHAEILASAIRLVRKKGIAGASVADVMRGAGLTVGGFYAHFGSKESLVDDVIRQSAALLRSTLFARIEEKPADARAEIVLKRYLSAAHRDEADTGCPLPAIAGEIATQAPAHGKVLTDELEQLARELAALLPQEAASRRDRALGLLALMVGGLTLARAVRGTPLSDDVLRACRGFGRIALRAARDGSRKSTSFPPSVVEALLRTQR